VLECSGAVDETEDHRSICLILGHVGYDPDGIPIFEYLRSERTLDSESTRRSVPEYRTMYIELRDDYV